MPGQKRTFPADTDGRTYAGNRDPPGQASFYIPSGDTWKEAYRTSTYARFPESPVFPIHLSASGFYYTGFKDRVKCFSCGLCVENWIIGDDPREKIWHKSDCEFANGADTRNIPLPNLFSHFRSISPRRNVSPSLAGPRSSNANPHGQVNHTPNHSTPNVCNQSSEVQISTQETRHQLYPCTSPVNPHMTSVVSRLESFKPRNGIRWPSERLRATIDQLVNAGFFYLGERDRVKCWYCNGGLQNWDYDDEPFEEHAKWFPSCEYVLRIKGPAFVRDVVARFPDIDRPAPITFTRPQQQNEAVDIPPPFTTPSSGNGSSPSGVADAVEHAMQSLQYVRQAREIGFAENLIKDVLTRKYQSNGQFFTNQEEFMDALITYQSDTNVLPTAPALNENTSLPSNEQTSETSNNTFSELRKLEEARLCKICRREPSSVVIIPCGHLSVCNNCVGGLRKCPICSRAVQDTIKTFRA
ncbi:baculoviral IAP repeat-containing protein 7-like [Styela clava]